MESRTGSRSLLGMVVGVFAGLMCSMCAFAKPLEAPPDACVPEPPRDLSITLAASTAMPGFTIEIGADGNLSLEPLVFTSDTDVMLLPSFTLYESLSVGLVFDWFVRSSMTSVQFWMAEASDTVKLKLTLPWCLP